MNILIVGAGSVGSVLAKMLAKRGSRVTVATNDISASKKFLGRHRGIRVVKSDASKTGSIARAAKGFDVIINAAHSTFNLRLMDAALAVGANYVDFSSMLRDWKHAEQLGRCERFARAGLIALINVGVSPGLTNLLAAEEVANVGGKASLKFRILEEQISDRLIPTWSPSVLKDELTAWPLIYRNGKFGFSRPLIDHESFRFPKPFGPRQVFSIYGDEIATIPLFLNVRDADYKAGGREMELVAAGKRASMGVPTPEEMRRFVRTGVIRDARLIVSVSARGTKGTHTTHAVFPDIRQIMRKASGATYIGYPTALCAAAFVGILPKITARGVFPAETLPASLRKLVLKRLRADGVKFATMRR